LFPAGCICNKVRNGLPPPFCGIARVPLALGQETFLRPPTTNKATEYEVKIGSKVRKKQKQNVYPSYYTLFEENKT